MGDNSLLSAPLVVMIAIGVTSEPVPAVVGTRTSGMRGPFATFTPNTSLSDWPVLATSDATLATSIGEPPPIAITPVAPHAVMKAARSWTLHSGGSTAMSSKIATSIPAFANDASADR